jgi:hypothetical protein
VLLLATLGAALLLFGLTFYGLFISTRQATQEITFAAVLTVTVFGVADQLVGVLA